MAGSFGHDLFGCFDYGAAWCLTGWFCGPCTSSKVKTSLEGDKDGWNILYMVLGYLIPMLPVFLNRREICQKYNIDETPVSSVLLAIFCSPCAEIQNASELADKSEYDGFFCGRIN